MLWFKAWQSWPQIIIENETCFVIFIRYSKILSQIMIISEFHFIVLLTHSNTTTQKQFPIWFLLSYVDFIFITIWTYSLATTAPIPDRPFPIRNLHNTSASLGSRIDIPSIFLILHTTWKRMRLYPWRLEIPPNKY